MSSLWGSSKVQYSRLPTTDTGADWHQKKDYESLDFSSAFSYKSAFTYSKVAPPYVHEERSYSPPLATRICSKLVIILSYLFVLFTFPVTAWIAIKSVEQFERLVVFRLGRLQEPKGPGYILVLPFADKWRRVDMRTRAFNVPPQQILTDDGAAISIGATVYHRITDVALSIASIQDLNHSIRVLGQTVLLSLLSQHSLTHLKTYKQHLNAQIQEELDKATKSWGVEVSRVELSEVTVIQESAPMSAEKVGGILGQLAGQMTGGTQQGTWLQSLMGASSSMQPVLLPPSNLPTPGAVPRSNSQTHTVTPDELMAMITPVLNQELVRNVDAIYVFHITGDSGGTYYLDLKTGCGTVGRGKHPTCQPDVVLTMSSEDMQAIFYGQLRPFVAYMSGQLVLEGDRDVAMRLDRVVSRLQEAKC